MESKQVHIPVLLYWSPLVVQVSALQSEELSQPAGAWRRAGEPAEEESGGAGWEASWTPPCRAAAEEEEWTRDLPEGFSLGLPEFSSDIFPPSLSTPFIGTTRWLLFLSKRNINSVQSPSLIIDWRCCCLKWSV